MAKLKKDLFGVVVRTDRGWTELDKVRRRFSTLEKKVYSGEFNADEMEEFVMLRAQIEIREKEAREAWAKSFGC